MGERTFYLNCEELGKLVELLHPDRKISDLTGEEQDSVFLPPLNLPPDYDLSKPGAVISAVRGTQPIFDFKDRKNTRLKIRTLYKRHCEGE